MSGQITSRTDESGAASRPGPVDGRVDRALADIYESLGPRIFWVIGFGCAGLGLFTAFGLIVPIIEDHGGRVDKFIGDGLLAVFGSPDRQADHADRALAAAMEIGRAVNSTDGLRVGIGLNSGTVITGSVGSHTRHEFGIIGDAVSAAARVESATRTTYDAILLTTRTRELLRDTDMRFIERPNIQLKGKTEKVTLYAPAPAHPEMC
jgi:class 3 adenylate cyclase